MAAKISGIWKSKIISIKDEWNGHKFTSDELEKLFNDETIDFPSMGRSGPYRVSGKIELQEYRGFEFFGFKPNFNFYKETVKGTFCNEKISIQKNMPFHCLTENEIAVLFKGGSIIYKETDLNGDTYKVIGHLDTGDVKYIINREFLYSDTDFDTIDSSM